MTNIKFWLAIATIVALASFVHAGESNAEKDIPFFLGDFDPSFGDSYSRGFTYWNGKSFSSYSSFKSTTQGLDAVDYQFSTYVATYDYYSGAELQKIQSSTYLETIVSFTSINDKINALAVGYGYLWFAGSFGIPYGGVVSLNNIGYTDGNTIYRTSNGGIGRPPYTINALYWDSTNSLLYVGTSGGYGLYAYNPRTGVWTAPGQIYMNSATTTQVYALYEQKGFLYVGGQFTSASFYTSGIAKYNMLLGYWSSVGYSGTTGTIRAISGDGSTIFVGGSFSSIDGISANSLAKLTSTSTSFAPMGTGVGTGVVYTLYYDTLSSRLYIGGSFLVAGDVFTYNVAYYHKSTYYNMQHGLGSYSDTVFKIKKLDYVPGIIDFSFAVKLVGGALVAAIIAPIVGCCCIIICLIIIIILCVRLSYSPHKKKYAKMTTIITNSNLAAAPVVATAPVMFQPQQQYPQAYPQ